MYQARSRYCLASTYGTELRLLGCCKPVPHPLQRMPEKHLARQGIFGFLAACRQSVAWCSHNSTCDDIRPTSCAHLTPARAPSAVPASFHRCYHCPFVARSGECVQSPFLDSSTARAAREMSLSPHVVASRSLPRLLRALPTQPSRQAARWGGMAARNQTRRFRMLVRRNGETCGFSPATDTIGPAASP
jgi:hypothetical protein